jgi:hypothetical protein
MLGILKNYCRRVVTDIFLFCVATIPAIITFYSDSKGLTSDFFMRSGAIMALFGAFLEFRTHEIQALRDRDNFHRIWGTIGMLTEGLANVDMAAKYSLRSISTLIESAGIEPDIGKAETIKDMVVTEKIKALKYLPLVPEIYYTYSSYMALIGKTLVVSGTIIWAFGDCMVNLYKASM